MAGAEEKIVRRKEREPIAMVCFAVLLVASVAVIGAYINTNYISKNNETVQYGDSVELDYTGSLYGFYDQSSDTLKPIIFDTSIESIGKNTDYLFTSSSSKTDYNALTTVLGKGQTLAYFDSMLIGKKVGETVRFMVPAADAYPVTAENKVATSFDFPISYANVSADQIKTFFGLEEYTGGPIDSVIPVTVTPNGSNYNLTYSLMDSTYVIMDSSIGKVTLNVSGVAGGIATCTLTIENKLNVKNTASENMKVTVNSTDYDMIEMLSIKPFYNNYLNIVGYDGTNVVYNNGSGNAQIGGMDLYFEVKILKKN